MVNFFWVVLQIHIHSRYHFLCLLSSIIDPCVLAKLLEIKSRQIFHLIFARSGNQITLFILFPIPESDRKVKKAVFELGI